MVWRDLEGQTSQLRYVLQLMKKYHPTRMTYLPLCSGVAETYDPIYSTYTMVKSYLRLCQMGAYRKGSPRGVFYEQEFHVE